MPSNFLNEDFLYHVRVLACLSNRQNVINDYYYKVSGPGVPNTTIDTFSTAFGTAFQTQILPIMPIQYEVYEIQVRAINGNTGSKFDPMGNPIAWKVTCDELNIQVLGGAMWDGEVLGQEFLPFYAAALVGYSVPGCGHDRTGRIFHTPVLEDQQADGRLTDAAQLALQLAYSPLLAAVLPIVAGGQVDARHVLFRRTAYNRMQQPAAPAGEYTPVTDQVYVRKVLSRRISRAQKIRGCF